MPVDSIQVLIVDDEAAALAYAVQNIEHFVPGKQIYTATNSVEVARLMKSVPFDLVFIDMEMPDNDGFSIAKYLEHQQPHARYAFLTGHTELGAKSYEYDAIDFLCKPVTVERLKLTFERYEKLQMRTPYAGTKLAINTTDGIVLLSPDEILFITREGRKVSICCTEQSLYVKRSLEELELILEEFDFIRCHQSYIVSVRHITRLKQGDFGRTYWVELDNGQRVPVSRQRYPALRDLLKER